LEFGEEAGLLVAYDFRILSEQVKLLFRATTGLKHCCRLCNQQKTATRK